MKITVDTHVLLRAIVADDPEQASAAVKALAHAEVVAVSLTALCELSSVLQGSNGVARADVVATIRQLIETQQIEVNRSAVEAGLSVLTAGGDFADGIIAYDGRWLGGAVFVSFDRKAVKLLTAQGHAAQVPTDGKRQG